MKGRLEWQCVIECKRQREDSECTRAGAQVAVFRERGSVGLLFFAGSGQRMCMEASDGAKSQGQSEGRRLSAVEWRQPDAENCDECWMPEEIIARTDGTVFWTARRSIGGMAQEQNVVLTAACTLAHDAETHQKLARDAGRSTPHAHHVQLQLAPVPHTAADNRCTRH